MRHPVVEVKVINGHPEAAQMLLSFRTSSGSCTRDATRGGGYGTKMPGDGAPAQVYNAEWKLLEKMLNKHMGVCDEHH